MIMGMIQNQYLTWGKGVGYFWIPKDETVEDIPCFDAKFFHKFSWVELDCSSNCCIFWTWIWVDGKFGFQDGSGVWIKFIQDWTNIPGFFGSKKPIMNRKTGNCWWCFRKGKTGQVAPLSKKNLMVEVWIFWRLAGFLVLKILKMIPIVPGGLFTFQTMQKKHQNFKVPLKAGRETLWFSIK